MYFWTNNGKTTSNSQSGLQDFNNIFVDSGKDKDKVLSTISPHCMINIFERLDILRGITLKLIHWKTWYMNFCVPLQLLSQLSMQLYGFSLLFPT
jgi:hypothetical protein